jgi:dihydrofolate reductase
MSKTILYTAVTLDGYIASKNGSVAFLDDPNYTIPEEDYGYAAFYDSVDVVVMGYNTYKQVSEFEGAYPYHGKRSIVLSNSDDVPSVDEGVEIRTASPAEVVRELQKEGLTIWIIGGGATNARLHEEGLIDELILTYVPVTLGEGIPLFRANATSHTWKNSGTRSYPNGLVQMSLSIVRS